MKKSSSAFLIVSFLAACSGEIVDVRGKVEASSSVPQFAVGQQIFISITNSSDRDLFFNPCVADLEYHEATSWRLISGRICDDFGEKPIPWRRIGPGEAIRDSTGTAVTYPRGEYRMLFDVRSDTKGKPQAPVVNSNVFLLN